MALGIFVDRLPLVRSDVRVKSASAIGDIIEEASRLLTRVDLVSVSLSTIQVVASTALESDDAALAQVMPKLMAVIEASKNNSDLSAALSLVEMTLLVPLRGAAGLIANLRWSDFASALGPSRSYSLL